jgi:hypothetical protein
MTGDDGGAGIGQHPDEVPAASAGTSPVKQ